MWTKFISRRLNRSELSLLDYFFFVLSIEKKGTSSKALGVLFDVSSNNLCAVVCKLFLACEST